MGIPGDAGADEVPDGTRDGRMAKSLDERFDPPSVNSSEKTHGTVCDKCASFEVLLRKRHYGIKESYWCNARHSRIDPFRVKMCGMKR